MVARGLLEMTLSGLFYSIRLSASAYQLRNLFMTVLVYRDVSNVRALFDQYWKYMADDIDYRLRIALNNLSYIVPDSVLQSGLMKELNDMFSNNGLFISSYDLPV